MCLLLVLNLSHVCGVAELGDESPGLPKAPTVIPGSNAADHGCIFWHTQVLASQQPPNPATLRRAELQQNSQLIYNPLPIIQMETLRPETEKRGLGSIGRIS